MVKLTDYYFLRHLLQKGQKNMKINHIKKAVIFLTVLTFSCTMVFAEPPLFTDSNSPVCEGKRPDAPFQHHWFMQEFNKKLNLTDAQKTAIEQIVTNEVKEIQKIRENSRNQINAVLTPEQQKEFAAIRSEKHPRMHNRAGDRLQMLAEKLNLTEAQTAAIQPIFAAEANDIKTVRQDNSLSKEEKKGKVLAIREAAKEKIAAILTPEQKTEWVELKEHRMWMRHKEMRRGPRHKPCEQPPPPEKQEPADSNA